jgi:hypothetical protein
MTVRNDQAHSGSRCGEANLDGKRAYAVVLLSEEPSSTFADVWFNVQSQGDNAIDLAALLGDGSQSIARVILNASGKVALLAGPTNKTYTSVVAPSEHSWHELYVHVDTGTTGQSEVFLDGKRLTALSKTADFGTLPVGQLKLGDAHVGRTSDTLYDDVSVDNQPK